MMNRSIEFDRWGRPNDIPRRRAVAMIGSLAGASVVASGLRLEALDIADSGGAPDDEDFWSKVRSAFDLPKGITNLDNAAYGPIPRAVMDDLIADIRYM